MAINKENGQFGNIATFFSHLGKLSIWQQNFASWIGNVAKMEILIIYNNNFCDI